MTSVATRQTGLLRRMLHSVFNRFGLEVRLVRNIRSAESATKEKRHLVAWDVIKSWPFSLILDIGANKGQFARLARRLWPQVRIHSFEPLPDVFRELQSQFADDVLVVTHNIGLSDRPGTQKMHRSEFSPSSSLLPMADLHRSEWPESVAHTEIEVELVRLDDWSSKENLAENAITLVKIDVQGFELAVINGGMETLRSASVIVIEVSYYELYEGQPLFGQIYNRLNELGFVYRGNIEQYYSRDRSRVLYADAVFENAAKVSPSV